MIDIQWISESWNSSTIPYLISSAINCCIVVDGAVRADAHARLLRDNVVVYTGEVGSLRRFKDEVKEVKEGTECGMAFENYDDIKDGDVIECYEVIEEARTVT